MTVRTLDYSGIRQVVVDSLGEGSITISAGADPNRVEGSIDAGDEAFLAAVQIRQARDALRISLPQGFWRSTTAHLKLLVPPGLAFVIKTGAADVALSADIGPSKIASGSGHISIGRAVDLDCSTGSGNIDVAELDGNGARLRTGSGHISVGAASCPVSVKSGSGHIDVKSLDRSDLQASSGSGEVVVTSTTGSVDVRTASGVVSVGVADRLATWLDLSSGSGEVHIGLDAIGQPEPGEPHISVRARTASGGIEVFRA
jgi:Putative adhesin